ncbi:hypothetical protein GF314_11450 [bacterium]|nr:hypothetical protein [bacterium]
MKDRGGRTCRCRGIRRLPRSRERGRWARPLPTTARSADHRPPARRTRPMSSQHSGQAPHLSCGECQSRLQDYLDDALARPDSMQVYLHVRECADCAEALARLETLVARLESLPGREAPADFDARVLASVPYESYRAMAALRAPRVPTFLASDSLPAWIRRPVVRMAGAGLAAVAAAAWSTILPEPTLLIAAALGLVPELLVRLQAGGRLVAQALAQGRERT